MPFISAWFHLVWATRNRLPFLIPEIRKHVFDHIKSNAIEKEIFIACANGHKDHMHCPVSLACDQSISEIVQLIKGESSYWINKEKLIKRHFAWQDGYFAVSVSFSQLKNVRNYINNQETHHNKITWDQEYDEFVGKYKFQKPGPSSFIYTPQI